MEALTAAYPVLEFHSKHIPLCRPSVTFLTSRTCTLPVSDNVLLRILCLEVMGVLLVALPPSWQPVFPVNTQAPRRTGSQFRQLNNSSSKTLVTEAPEVRPRIRTLLKQLPLTGLTRRMCSAHRAAVRHHPFHVHRRHITTSTPPHHLFIINSSTPSNP